MLDETNPKALPIPCITRLLEENELHGAKEQVNILLLEHLLGTKIEASRRDADVKPGNISKPLEISNATTKNNITQTMSQNKGGNVMSVSNDCAIAKAMRLQYRSLRRHLV